MDTNTAIIVIVVIFAIVIVAAFFLYQQRGKAKIKTPLGSLEIDASNQPPTSAPPSGAHIESVTSGGKVQATDGTGTSATVKDAEAYGDITATTSKPGRGPKARPPA